MTNYPRQRQIEWSTDLPYLLECNVHCSSRTCKCREKPCDGHVEPMIVNRDPGDENDAGGSRP